MYTVCVQLRGLLTLDAKAIRRVVVVDGRTGARHYYARVGVVDHTLGFHFIRSTNTQFHRHIIGDQPIGIRLERSRRSSHQHARPGDLVDGSHLVQSRQAGAQTTLEELAFVIRCAGNIDKMLTTHVILNKVRFFCGENLHLRRRIEHHVSTPRAFIVEGFGSNKQLVIKTIRRVFSKENIEALTSLHIYSIAWEPAHTESWISGSNCSHHW